MSKDNTNVSREGYLTELRQRLERDVRAVATGQKPGDWLIDFIVDEIYTSYKRGIATGRELQKKAYQKGKPDKASLSR